MTVKTTSLEGFIAALEHIIDHAKHGRLVACSINLDPTHLGHYAYKLFGGAEATGDVVRVDFGEEETAPTAPGKKSAR